MRDHNILSEFYAIISVKTFSEFFLTFMSEEKRKGAKKVTILITN